MKLIISVSLLLLISLSIASKVKLVQTLNNATNFTSNLTQPTLNMTRMNASSLNATTMNFTDVRNISDTENNYTFFVLPPVLPSGHSEDNWKLIPQNFWVDYYGQPGREFIMLNTTEGLFSCDPMGKLMLKKEFSPNALWIPKPIGKNNENVLYLQNFFGGYLNVNLITKTIDCFPRYPTASNIFKIAYSIKPSESEMNMLLMNEGFVTYLKDNNFIASKLDMNNSTQFFSAPRNFSTYTNDDVDLWANIYGVMMP
jgi:hypothetical protein